MHSAQSPLDGSKARPQCGRSPSAALDPRASAQDNIMMEFPRRCGKRALPWSPPSNAFLLGGGAGTKERGRRRPARLSTTPPRPALRLPARHPTLSAKYGTCQPRRRKIRRSAISPPRPLVELPDDVGADFAGGGQDPKEIPPRRWSERVGDASRILPRHRGASVSAAFLAQLIWVARAKVPKAGRTGGGVIYRDSASLAGSRVPARHPPSVPTGSNLGRRVSCLKV